MVVSDRGGDRTSENVGLGKGQGAGANETAWPSTQELVGALTGARSLMTLRLADVIEQGYTFIVT